ncbi:unnamed protein product [Bemisia tabaci]|uniref:Imaginal disc growth factor n=1 Tax=Bemisia tabaci TaxID=7038 RepID=A0A8K1P8G4_BEMTA|nr:imaginal disc growth factor [Bemisia tabaci]CAH0391548.1 unnamed protein product [Bemisia tabaci]
MWFKLSVCVLAALVAAKIEAAKVVCYYDGDSYFRDGRAKVTSEDLKPALAYCNQIIYGWYGIGSDNDIDTLGKSDSDKGKVHIRAVTALKKTSPNLKVLLSIGGWADKEDVDKYLTLLETPERRTKFANSVAKKVDDYGFDGVDLAWEFPPDKEPKERGIFGSLWHGTKKIFSGDRDKNPEAHREQFSALARELKAVLRPKGHLLSISNLPHVNNTVYYDIPILNPSVDQYIIHSYDFRTPDRTPKQADYSAPLYFPQNRVPFQNVEAMADKFIKKGATPDKIIIAVPTFGRTWAIDSDSGKTGQPPLVADGKGKEGTYTKTEGLLSYYEICPHLVTSSSAKVDGVLLRKVPDPSKRAGAYAYRLPGKEDGIWVSYEDPEQAAAKALFARNKNYGGVAVVDLSLDDFKGMCDGTPFPITRAVKSNLL